MLASELTKAVARPKRAKRAAEQPTQDATEKPKAKKLKKAAETITLGELAEQYIAALEEEGKSDGTLFSYKLEMRTALAALGENTRLADLFGLAGCRLRRRHPQSRHLTAGQGLQQGIFRLDLGRRCLLEKLRGLGEARPARRQGGFGQGVITFASGLDADLSEAGKTDFPVVLALPEQTPLLGHPGLHGQRSVPVAELAENGETG